MCFAWGVADVYRWVDETDPKILDFWMAFDAIEPIGDQWRQTAEIKSLIAQLIAAQYTNKVEVPTPEDCMPYRYIRTPKEEPKKIDKQQEFAAVLQSLGFTPPNGNNNQRG